MSDTIRLLNDEAIEEFRRYLIELRYVPETPPPVYLLDHPSASLDAPFSATIAREPNGEPFRTRLEFGQYLVQVLSTVDGAVISRNHRLWAWLALYYFDQICPPGKNGSRTPLKDYAAYVLDSEFNYTDYYRHLVRTPWIAVSLHPALSRVVLTPLKDVDAPLAQRGELIEQIASRQSLFRSPVVMAVADQMYYDPAISRPRRGSGSSGAGSPRRFATVLNQLDLTYDLESVTPDMIIARLPKEFDRWKRLAT